MISSPITRRTSATTSLVRSVFFFVVAVVCLTILWFLAPQASYQGQSTSFWAQDLECWEQLALIKSRGGERRVWIQRPGSLERVFPRLLGPSKKSNLDDHPLMQGDETGLDVLAELLRHPNARVRLLALEGIRRTGRKAKRILPSIQQAAQDADFEVREEASQVLQQMIQAQAEADNASGTDLPSRRTPSDSAYDR
jgi:hypothetical protein